MLGVASTPASMAVHDGVSCDGCGVAPLRGVRYRCAFCPNYDLCARCLEAGEATPYPVFGTVVTGAAEHAGKGHLFLRVPSPSAFPPDSWLLANRAELTHVGFTCAACNAAIRACPYPPFPRQSTRLLCNTAYG